MLVRSPADQVGGRGSTRPLAMLIFPPNFFCFLLHARSNFQVSEALSPSPRLTHTHTHTRTHTRTHTLQLPDFEIMRGNFRRRTDVAILRVPNLGSTRSDSSTPRATATVTSRVRATVTSFASLHHGNRPSHVIDAHVLKTVRVWISRAMTFPCNVSAHGLSYCCLNPIQGEVQCATSLDLFQNPHLSVHQLDREPPCRGHDSPHLSFLDFSEDPDCPDDTRNLRQRERQWNLDPRMALSG